MTELPKWLSKGTSLTQIKDVAEILTPITALADEWETTAKGLIELGVNARLGNSLQLVDYVLDNLDDANVKTVLDALGAGDLAGDLAGIKGKYADSQYSKLLKPVGTFAESYDTDAKFDEGRTPNPGSNEGLISLDLDKKGSVSGKAGKLDLTLGLEASAKLEVEAGSVWPFEIDSVPAGLLRLGLGVGAGVEAGAKLPAGSWASFGFDAEAQARAELGYFYRPTGNPVFLSALLPAIKRLDNPASLTDLINSMALYDLEGVVMLVDGSVGTKAEVSLGHNIALDGVATVKLGVSGSVRYKRASTWVLSIRRVKPAKVKPSLDQEYEVILSRKKSSEKGWKAGVGITADISALAQKANGALGEITGFVDERLETIKPFLSPGTYALEKLDTLYPKAVEALVEDEGLASAIKRDIGLLTGASEDDDLSVGAWVTEQLSAALDEVTGGISNKADKLASEAITILVDKLPEEFGAKVGTDAEKAVKDLTKALIKDFETEFGKLTSTQSKSKALAAELRKVGAEVKATAKNADEVFEGVRDLIANYEKYAKILRERLKELAEKEIGASLELEYSKTDSTEIELVATITEDNDATGEIWNDLAFGRMQSIQTIIADPARVPNGFVIREGSSITQISQSSKGLSFSINFLGDVLRYSAVAEGKATFVTTLDGFGVDAMAKVTKTRASILSADRSTSFVSVYDLQRFKEGAEERDLDISISMLREDERLKPSELETFLKRLVKHNLVDEARAKAAEEHLQDAIGGTRRLAGDVGLQMNATQTQLDNLLAIGRASNEPNHIHRALFIATARILIDVDDFYRRRYDQALEWNANSEDETQQYRALYQHRVSLMRTRHQISRDDREGEAIDQLGKAVRHVVAMPKLFEKLAATYSAMPTTVNGGEWTADDYRKEQQSIAELAQTWVPTKEGIFVPSLHPRLVTLLRLMLAMDNQEAPRDKAGLVTIIEGLSTPLVSDPSDRRVRISMRLGNESVPTYF